MRLESNDLFFQLIRGGRHIEISEAVFQELGLRIFQLSLTFDIRNITRRKVADVIGFRNHLIELVGNLEAHA